MAAVISGNGLGLFNSSLQAGLGLGSDARLGAQGSTRQYVNIANGNLVLQGQDEQLLFRGMSIGQLRTYNSQGLPSQVGADGWLTGFERRVELLAGTVNSAGSIMRLHTGDGAFQDFAYAGNGSYQSTSGDGAHDSLTYASATRSWTYVEGSTRREETYADHANATLKGRLTRLRDLRGDAANPTTWDVLYDGAGRITQIRSKDIAAGATPDGMVFSYDAAGRLSGISTRENGVLLGQVGYGYDSVGRLTSVLVDLTPRDGVNDRDSWDAGSAAANDGYLFRTTYSYVDATSLQISQVRRSDGLLVSYTYDTAGRIRSVTSGDANADDSDGVGQTLFYSYDTNNRRTDISDAGGRTWTYGYDAAGQLIEVQGPASDGLRDVSQYAYDADGNLVQSVTRRAGQVLAQADFEYDAQGNLTWQWNRVEGGASAASAIHRTYTAGNQLASETVFAGLDADGAGSAAAPSGGATIHYLYDAQNRLRFTINPAGEVSESRYAGAGNGIGQLASTRRYLGATFSGTFTTTDLETWAAGQLAQSGLTEYAYDLRGRLSQTRAYAQVDGAGNGVQDDGLEIIDYVHDAQGLLREKAVTRYAGGRNGGVASQREVASYTYDGMGRLLSEIVQQHALDGASDVLILRTSTWIYQDSGSTVRTVLQGGGDAGDLLRTEVRDAAGRLLLVTDSAVAGNGGVRSTQNIYDALGQLRAVQDANGGRTYFFYDAEGLLVGQVDATGAVVEYVRDPLGRAISTIAYATRVDTGNWLAGGAVVPGELANVRPPTGSDDRRTYVTYDALGHKLSETDAEGGIVTYLYDGAGRLLRTTATDAAGTAETARVQRYFYDATGRERARLDANGYLTEFQRDAGGRLVRTSAYATMVPVALRGAGDLDAMRPGPAAADAVTRYFHDGRGNLVGQLDAEGYLTEYVYDEARNQRAVKVYALRLDAADPALGFNGLRTLAQAGAARTTQRSYDAAGRLVVEVTPEGRVTRFSYDAQGRLLGTTSAAGTDEQRQSLRRYDAFGNLIGELNAEGSALYTSSMSASELDALYAQYGVRHSYDLLGRRIQSTDAAGYQTWYFHDAAGRVTHTVYGTQDASGRLNAEGEVEETRYDAFGQARETIRYTGRLQIDVPFGWEQASAAVRVLQYVAAIDSRQQYRYDRRGLLAELTRAEGYRTLYTHNAFGDLVEQRDQIDGSQWRVTRSSYDRLGQRTELLEDADGLQRATSSAFDAFGRIIRSSDGRGNTTGYEYDRLGRQVAVTRMVGGQLESMQTTYDAYGRTLSQTDAIGRTTQFLHDDADRTLTMITPEGVQVITRYNLHGQTVEILRGDGSSQVFAYDADGRLVEESIGAGYAVSQTTYRYDIRGKLAGQSDGTGREVTFQYDARGRILERRQELQYALQDAVVTRYTYDGQGRQLSITDASGRRTVMEYDREGRLLASIVDPDGLSLRTTFSWDALGRRLSVTEGAGTADARSTTYSYDGLGRRTAQVVAAGALNLLTRFSYDANDNLVASQDPENRITRYVYDDSNRLRFTVNPQGGVTEQRYDPAGQRVSVRQYAGQINLAGLPEQATLVEVQQRLQADDGKDLQTYLLYDRDGRQTLSIDAAGAVTQQLFDRAGNVVQTRRYATAYPLDAGRRGLLAAGQGQQDVVLAELVVSDADRVDSYVHDAAGRVRFHLNSDRAVVETNYDLAGRVVNRYEYADFLPTITHAAIAAGTVSADDITSDLSETYWELMRGVSFIYDGAGRLSFTLTRVHDATRWGYGDEVNSILVQRNIYDGSGNIVSDVTYTYALDPTRETGAYDSEAAVIAALFGEYGEPQGLQTAPERTNQHVYDQAGRERFSVGPDGAVTEYRYDAMGQRIETRHYGEAVEPRRWGEAELAAAVAGIGSVRISRQEYDAAGRVISRTDPLTAVERYQYDGAGQLLAYTDKNQAVWTYQYDAAGRRTLETSPVVIVSIAAADGTLSTVARSISTLTEYDALGNVTRRIEDAGTPTARATEYEYDSRGLQIRTRFPDAGRMNVDGQLVATGERPTVEVTYNALGQAVMQKDVLGYYSYNTYDAAGRLQFEVDAEGYVSAYGYDAFGKQTRFQRYANPIALPSGQVAKGSDVAALLVPATFQDRIQRKEYDVAGRLLRTYETRFVKNEWDAEPHEELGGGTKAEYDLLGNMISEGRMVSANEWVPAGSEYVKWSEVNYRYDIAGRRIASVDDLGFFTAWTYNANGEVMQEWQVARPVWEPVQPTLMRSIWNDGIPFPEVSLDGGTAELGFDRVTEWQYDALGRKISERVSRGNPYDGNFVESLTAYDASGRVIQTTVDGQASKTFYDALGRVTAIRESERDVVNGNADIQLASTGVGLGSGSLYRRASPYSSMAYDAFGNVVQVRRYAEGAEPGQAPSASSQDQVQSTVYDWQGRGVLERDALGSVTARTYDAADRLLATRSRLDGNAGRWSLVVNQATYDKVGRQLTSVVSRELYQTGSSAALRTEVDSTSQVRYNAFGEIIAKDSRLDASLVTDSFAVRYVYDQNGRVSSTNAEGGVWRNFAYDLSGHVIAEWHSVRDSAGNLINVETRMELDTRGNVLEQHLPTSNDDPFDQARIIRTYDRWGNVLSMTDPRGGTTTYEYNQRNQLVREIKPEVRVLDANGTARSVRPETLWEYDVMGRNTGVRDANGNWQRTGYDGAGRQIYTETATGNRTFIAYDAFGQKRYTQDPLGYVTFLEYDRGGRVVAQGDFLREADGATRQRATRERYTLNQNGNRIRVNDALGYASTYDYDSRGLVIRSHTAAGVGMSYAYDAQGNKIRETNALSDPSLAADGQPVFNGGLVESQYGVVGQAFSHTLGAGAFSIVGGEIPSLSVRVEYWDATLNVYRDAPGFSYDPQTRVLSGTPAQTGPYRITYTATSSNGKSASITASLYSVTQAAYDSYYAGAPKANTGLFNRSVGVNQAFSYQVPPGTFTAAAGQGISYSAQVYALVETFDYETRQHVREYQWVTLGSAEDDSGFSFDAATATLSGTPATRGTWQVQIVATGANGRSSALGLTVEARQADGRRTVTDAEGDVLYLDENTWKYDYFGRLIDHNDLSGADYNYSYDAVTGQLLGENSKWTEQGRQYSTPATDYWYDRDWRQYGLDSELVGLDLPDPVLLNDPARSYSYYKSGALKELREGNNWFRYQYDAAGNRTSEEAYTYDADGQLLHVLTKVTYDAHGRITKVIQQDVSAGRRLLELNYDYDAVGNRRRVLARSAYDADSPGIDINGITNPDFEDGDFGWKRGDGWTIVPGGENGSTQRAQFHMDGTSKLMNIQRVQVTPGERITAAVRVDQGASSAGKAGAAVIIEWYDASGALISTSEGNMVDSASGGAIYESRVIADAPWEAVFMSIGARAFRDGDNDELFVDNFSWGAMPYNGGLDNNYSWNFGDYWSPTGWSWSSEYGGSAQFNRTGEGRMVSHGRLDVRPGSQVSARVNVQQGASSAGEAWGAVFLRFFDANGSIIADVEGNRVDSGSGGEWHESVLSTKVPPGAMSMSIGAVAGRNGGTDPLWVDDFSWNYERDGELDSTGNYVDPDPSDPYNMAEPFKVYWYDYDAQNRVKVANGRLVNNQIVLGNADVSYALDYDEAGRAVRRRYLSGLTEVSETTQYDDRGQRLKVFQAVGLDSTAPVSLKDSYSYDAMGRVIEQRTYFDAGSTRNGIDIGGWLKHAETFSYDADGRILRQSIQGRELGWTATAQNDGGAAQVTQLGVLQNLAWIDYSAYGYDAAGRLRGYTYQYSLHEESSGALPGDPKGYTHRYTYSYEARDSYLESRIYGQSSNQNFRASTSYSSYDAWGRRVAVREQTPLSSDLGKLDDRIRYFSYDGTGSILRRREGSLAGGVFTQSAAQKTQTQLYAYVGGQLVASGKRNGEVDVVGRLTAYQSNNAAGSSRTTVQAGETLRGIAQRVYGNANLWYVLAEANAIADDSGLTAGTTLVVPEVKVTANDASTFKPFNPQEAIGNTSPSLPYIEPPPKEHCNGIAMVLMVIVAVVATVFTAGAAALAFGAVAAGTGAFAAGTAVLTGTAMAAATGFAATAAVAGAAFVGGMAGSIASQAVGKAMGVVDSFSLRSAVGSGLGAAAGAGIAGAIGGGAQVSELIQAGSYGRVAAIGAANAAAGYAAGKIAGVADTHFSWRAIAANAVSSVVGGKINQKLGTSVSPYVGNGIVNDTIGGMVGGVVSLHARRTFGVADDINYGAIAADAFGNALGSSMASAFSVAAMRNKQAVPNASGNATYDPTLMNRWHEEDMSNLRRGLASERLPVRAIGSFYSPENTILLGETQMAGSGDGLSADERSRWVSTEKYRTRNVDPYVLGRNGNQRWSTNEVMAFRASSAPAVSVELLSTPPAVTDWVWTNDGGRRVMPAVVSWTEIRTASLERDKAESLQYWKGAMPMRAASTAGYSLLQTSNKLFGVMTDAEYGRTIERTIGIVAQNPGAVARGLGKELGDWWHSPVSQKAEGVMAFGFETAATMGFSTLSKASYGGRAAADVAELATRSAVRSGDVAGAELLGGLRNADVVLNDTVSSIGEFSGSEALAIRVYRGTDNYNEIWINDETGHLLSDAARREYLETGSMDVAYESTRLTHQKWIDIWGSEARFIEEHSLRGTEFPREFGMDRTFMSVTTDLSVAQHYAGSGRVYSALVPASQLLKQTLATSTESEYLIRIGSDLFRPLPQGL